MKLSDFNIEQYLELGKLVEEILEELHEEVKNEEFVLIHDLHIMVSKMLAIDIKFIKKALSVSKSKYWEQLNMGIQRGKLVKRLSVAYTEKKVMEKFSQIIEDGVDFEYIINAIEDNLAVI